MHIPPDFRLAGAIDDGPPSLAADDPRHEDNNGAKIEEKVVCFAPYSKHNQLFACNSTAKSGPYA